MLSGPPFSFALSIKRCVALGKSGALVTICKIASSLTGPHKPSLQSTTQSLARGASKRVST
jgi:hypothetical protein